MAASVMNAETAPASAGARGEPSPAPRDDVSFTTVEGLALSLIAALAGTAVVGYRFGDSNHGITVPILKRFMDASLYPGDVMVATADKFPTVFFPLLARILPGPDWIPLAFFVGYVASIAATLAAAYRIGRWAGGTMEAGLLAALFTLPVRVGLAGEAVYRVAFSHSHVASALVLWAVVWFLEGRRLLPLLVLSLGAYNHLLYSAYMLVPLTLVVLYESRQRPRRETLKLLSAAVLPLLPLAVAMLGKSTPMTDEWLALLRERSALHSFPSTWAVHDWAFAAGFLFLALLSVSSAPVRKQRVFFLFLAGIALQFVVGALFSEWHPVKAVLQFQPLRCWRFLLVILFGWIAAGVVAGWREGGLARGAAVFTGLVVFVANGFEPLLPIVLVLGALLRRDARPWARLAVPVALVFVPGIGEGPLGYDVLRDYAARLFMSTAMLGLAIAVVLVVGRQTAPARRRRWVGWAALGLTLLWLAPDAYQRARARWESGSWREAQNWVRLNTPRDAVFLTPPAGEQAFRVFSERTIVGEWKDGTQQYFDDAFVREWGARMADLAGGSTQRPDNFVKRSDAELLELAARYRARYIVLPNDPPRDGLPVAYRNRHFTVYEARPR